MRTDNSKVGLVVVLPVCHADLHLAEKWLRWAGELSHDAKRYRLVVFCTRSLENELVARLRAAVEGFTFNVEIVETPGIYEQGYTPSANYMFRTALEHCERFHPGRAILWCEADTVPIHSLWVASIQSEYRECGEPFMGDFHAIGPIHHMTGNAVYHPEWRKFAPSLAKLPLPRPEQGWDTLCAHETVPQMARSKTIQQVWRPPVITDAWVQEHLWPTTGLFHQCKDGSLIDVLCKMGSYDEIPIADPLPRPSPRVAVARVISGLRTEIMIVTHRRDVEFLRYCMASIKKFAFGFAGVTLVVPSNERGTFDPFESAVDHVRVHYYDENPSKGMLHHQLMICRADEICPEAEIIVHVDADCMLWELTTPDDFLPSGRCLLVRESFDKIGRRNPNRNVWQQNVAKCAGFLPDWETMVRHPNVHPRELYPWVRRLVEATTGQPFDQYVLSQQNEFPQGFAEFPLLGAVGIRDFGDRYHFVDYDHDTDGREVGLDPSVAAYQYIYRAGRDKLVEFWSHGGIARYEKDMKRFLAGMQPSFHLK